MIEKIQKVSNPLTIVAIFAGLAEVSGTIVLPFIKENNQGPFIWFLMLFPTLLVLIFFAILLFKNKVLYAPSDFQDEKNFMDLFRPGLKVDKIIKMEAERSGKIEIEGNQPKIRVNIADTHKRNLSDITDTIKEDPLKKAMMAEGLVIDKISSELRTTPGSNNLFAIGGRKHLFDAVYALPNGMVAVEVKMVAGSLRTDYFRDTVDEISSVLRYVPMEILRNLKIIIAIACDMDSESFRKAQDQLMSFIIGGEYPIGIRLYNMNDLLKDLPNQ
jgi:hypothetical protein